MGVCESGEAKEVLLGEGGVGFRHTLVGKGEVVVFQWSTKGVLRLLRRGGERIDRPLGVVVCVACDFGVWRCVLGDPQAEGEAVYDGGEVVHEQDSELCFDFLLKIVSHKGNRVKGGRDLERFERIVSEDKRDALLSGEDEDDEAGEFDVGEGDLQGDGEAGRGG